MNKKTVKRIRLETPRIYNKVAPVFYQTRKKPWPIMDTIKPHIKLATNILDLGCGSGRLAEFISKDQNYLGIDNSKELISLAKANYENKNIKFKIGDAIESSLPKEKFDLVLLIAVLHHIPTKKLRFEVLKNINSALKPNGKLIITNWNLWQKQYRKYLFSYRIKFLKNKILRLNDAFIPWRVDNKKQWRYVHSLTKNETKKLLKKAGFEISEIYYEHQGERTNIFKGKNSIAIAYKVKSS